MGTWNWGLWDPPQGSLLGCRIRAEPPGTVGAGQGGLQAGGSRGGPAGSVHGQRDPRGAPQSVQVLCRV